MKKILLGTMVLLFCFSGCDTGTEAVVEAPDNSVTVLNAPPNGRFKIAVSYENYLPETWAEYENIMHENKWYGEYTVFSPSPIPIDWFVEPDKIPVNVIVAFLIQNESPYYFTKLGLVELDQNYRATVDWNTMLDISSLPGFPYLE